MIPVSKPSTTALEKKYVNEALEVNEISHGSFVTRFEGLWASMNKMKHGVTVSNGTTALQLALKAIGIKEGDEVIVPDFTMASCAFAVSYLGAIPRFVDCDDTLNINPALIADKITLNTKAIIVVHIYGRKANMEAIREVATKYRLKIIEDVAEGHGILPTGDIACYSFYGNKIVSTGEGGMCLTNDDLYADKMRDYKNVCFDKHRTFLHHDIGYNFRMTNLQCAVGLAQAERAREMIARRKEIETAYSTGLKPHLVRPRRHVLWMYDINTKNPLYLHDQLLEKGIDTRFFFRPLSSLEIYKQPVGQKADYYMKHGLQLPTYVDLTKEEIDYIIKEVNSLEE